MDRVAKALGEFPPLVVHDQRTGARIESAVVFLTGDRLEALVAYIDALRRDLSAWEKSSVREGVRLVDSPALAELEAAALCALLIDSRYGTKVPQR